MVTNTTEGLRTIRALLDSGAGANFISLRLAKLLKLKPNTSSLPEVKTLNNQDVHVVGQVGLRYDVSDTKGGQRALNDDFLVAGIHGFECVLGYNWLAKYDPNVIFSQRRFYWRRVRKRQTRLKVVIEPPR